MVWGKGAIERPKVGIGGHAAVVFGKVFELDEPRGDVDAVAERQAIGAVPVAVLALAHAAARRRTRAVRHAATALARTALQRNDPFIHSFIPAVDRQRSDKKRCG